MGTKEVAEEFDAISPAYDATRDPLDRATVDALVATLRQVGVQRVLEVGVGTGRIAGPLTERGLEVTGVDPSRGMLRRARAKGLSRLIRGSAYRLPFRSGSFDATLFVHVIHVLEEPERALAEAARVSQHGAFALVHPTGPGGEDPLESDSVRRLLFEDLKHRGFTIPDRGGPRRRERELLARHPPDRLTVLAERDVTESLSRRLDALGQRAHRWSLAIPPQVLQASIASVREQVGSREATFHRTEALALWRGPS